MKSYQETKEKIGNMIRKEPLDFDNLYESEMSVARQNFVNSIKKKFEEYGLECVIVKINKDFSNVFFNINNVPMRLFQDDSDTFKMIFQQYRIITARIPGLVANPNLKNLFPQRSFFNIESIVEHFEKNDLVNILKQYSNINNIAKTGVFENINNDDDEYMGHFATEYSKIMEDANYSFVDKIIEFFNHFNVECTYDDKGVVPKTNTPVLYFHVAGIPMQLNARNKITFEMYEKIKLDRPELRLVDKNIFYENSQLRSFFSVQECCEYFKKHDLLNKKLNPIARTGIFENVELSESENEFRKIEERAKSKIDDLFNQEVVKIFISKGLKCEFLKNEYGDQYFLIEGIPMRILNRNRMIFGSYKEIIERLPSVSATKLADDKTPILGEWHTFYAIDEVVDYFNDNNIVNILKNVKNINPIAKSGVFEKIKSFKNFGKES